MNIYCIQILKNHFIVYFKSILELLIVRMKSQKKKKALNRKPLIGRSFQLIKSLTSEDCIPVTWHKKKTEKCLSGGTEKVSSFYCSRSNIAALKHDRKWNYKKAAKKQSDYMKISGMAKLQWYLHFGTSKIPPLSLLIFQKSLPKFFFITTTYTNIYTQHTWTVRLTQ